MKKRFFLPVALFSLLFTGNLIAQRIYHSSGGEIIFSGANVDFQGFDVNTNLRFTLFLHAQHHLNLDLGNNVGLFTGLGLRNVGLITESAYQKMGFLDIDVTHPDYNKNTKIKRRSYSLGFPVALKLGSFKDHFFVFGGYEWEWMFHYKQKLFIDGDKYKFSEWTSNRVNTWIPSVFAGIQLPQGVRLKFKYYLEDFLNPDFTGVDFGEQVDYSEFGSSRIWYISLAFFLDKVHIERIVGKSDSSALSL